MTQAERDIRQGDEVILSSFSFVSTNNAFYVRGAKLVFVRGSKQSSVKGKKVRS